MFLYMRTIVSLLLGVFTTRILLEALGESDFGLYNVVGGSVSMMGFLSASLSSATQRFLSYAEGEGNKDKIKIYFNNAIIIHWVLALLMIIIFSIAGIFFFNGILNIPDGKLSTAVIIYVCLLISTVFSITIVPYEAEINAHENMLFFSIIGVIDVIVKFGIACLVLYLKSDKLILYAVLMAVESFLLRKASQIYCQRKYPECRKTELKANFDRSAIKEMTSFAGWNMANIATGMISLFGMNVVVNHYFGTDANAAMGVATQLSGIMMGLSANMLKAVTPVIVKSEGGSQHSRMLEFTYASCKFSCLIFSFVCIPAIIYIDPILNLWLTVVPKWTSIMCVILILSTLIEQLSVPLYQGIMAVGKIKGYTVSKSIANILPIIISILMFQFGDVQPYWVFINWGLWKSFIGGLVNVYYAYRLIGLTFKDYKTKVFIPAITPVLVSCAAYYLISLINTNWFVCLLVGGICSIFIYYIFALNTLEKSKILSFIRFLK